MCYKAAHLADQLSDIPRVAAVCVYPAMVKIARQAVGQSGIKVASVATGFPSGQYSLQGKLDDTKYAVDEGADEIDMVISRGHFLAGDHQYVLRRDRRGEVRVWTGALEGDPGNRRTRNPRQRPQGQRSRDARRRGLHQDQHRQGSAQCDTASDAWSCSKPSATSTTRRERRSA